MTTSGPSPARGGSASTKSGVFRTPFRNSSVLAKRARKLNVSRFRASTEEFLKGVRKTPDFVLAYPPRAGLFSLSLADRFKQVDAVESVKMAVEDGELNAKRARKLNIDHFRASTEEFLTGVRKTPDFVLADPPRAGLGPDVVKELLRIQAPKVGIVSCDPSTLARDLKGLCEAGYKIKSMTMVDLFPQTYHMETVTQLEL